MLLYILVFAICFGQSHILQNDYSFKYVGEFNYKNANEQCLKRRLSLARADTEESAKALYNYSMSISRNQYWIDVNNLTNETEWLHDDGTIASNNNWVPGRLNSTNETRCAMGNFNNTGWRWWNCLCTLNISTICGNEKSVTKEYGLLYIGDYNYTEANQECFKRSLRLVRADTVQSAKSVYDYATSRSLTSYWVDSNNMVNQNIWVHYDHTVAADNLWERKFSILYASTKHCVIGNFNGKTWRLRNTECKSKTVTICEHNFRYIGKYTYYHANEECHRRGLTLVISNSEKSAKGLYDYVSSFTKQQYWINGNNLLNKKQWVYNYGTPITKTFWYHGEPNGTNSDNCVVGNSNKSTFQWRNYNCNNYVVTICEHTLIYIGEYNFEQANRECFKLGLTLVRADTEEVAKPLHDYAVQHSLSNYWIDVINYLGTPSWDHYDRTHIFDSLWAPGKPDRESEDQCVSSSAYNISGMWTNCLCYLKMDTICEKRRIYIGDFTFNEANKECSKRGLSLVRADTEEASVSLYEFGGKIPIQYWIDARYDGKSHQWTHFDGTLAAEGFWKYGKPVDLKGSNCTVGNMEFTFSMKFWKRYIFNCDKNAATICV